MKIISFNINGLRARLHQLEAIIDRHQPDIIGLQETKVDDPQFPLSDLERFGYNISYFGQKAHYGVALLSKLPVVNVVKGFEAEEEAAQKRFIACEVMLGARSIWVCNGYFPQGESRGHPIKFPNKKLFYRNITDFVKAKLACDSSLVLMGDMNVALHESDIGIGEDNAKRWLRDGKCSFLPEEREWLQALLNVGLVDSYLKHTTDEKKLSWFDYRSRAFEAAPRRGLRIDLILVSENLIDATHSVGIDYDIRSMERPSDHCPLWWEMSGS